MDNKLKLLIFLLFALAGMLPIGVLLAQGGYSAYSGILVCALNVVGWALALGLVVALIGHTDRLRTSAQKLGVPVNKTQSLSSILDACFDQLNRKNSCLSINLVEKRISSKDELSKTLERIVVLAFRLVNAESAELALFDKDSGLYHSAFVLGKPFRLSAQAMLAGATEGEREGFSSPEILIHPIAFAGTILGTLRVALRKGTTPSTVDQDILRLLSLQSSVAIINCQYIGELLKMKQTSDDSVKAKTGFLANLSHELRGPLGIILNAVELVCDGLCGPVTEDQLETLKMVSSNGSHLLELINDVLDYAKVESGKVVANKVDIAVDDLLTDIVSVVRTQADAKGHKLIVRHNSDMLVLSCDRRHSRQILINMLSNAIKYTPDGGTIEVWSERARGGKVKVNVKDTGVGIDPADRHKVFAAFERVEHSYSMKQVGTGLGMPLSKRLAEVNGGSLDFVSTPGQGSVFSLSLPAVESANPILSAETKSERSIAGNGKRILFVAPDDGERKMLMRYLSHVGFVVLPVESAEDTRSMLHADPFHLVIVDHDISDSFMGDAATIIREEAKSSSLPVVLISSRAFVFDIEKELRSGVDRYLTKPIALDELGAICQELTSPLENESSRPSASNATPRPVRVRLQDDIVH